MASLLSPRTRSSSTRSTSRSTSRPPRPETDSTARPRRRLALLRLSATEAQEVRPSSSEDGPASMTWAVVAAGGAMAVALAGWVLVAGLSVLGWLSAAPGTLGAALSVGTELWLLANGAGARLGSATITLIPWGVTLLVAYMIYRVARLAARTAVERTRGTVAGVSVVTTAAYLAVLLSVALLRGHSLEAVRGAVVTAVVVGVASVWGSARGARVPLTASWPAWARRIPGAVLAAQLVLLGVGAALLLVSCLTHLQQIESLLVALDPGVAGHLTLLVLQLAFVPNLVVWSASYAIGAGFGFGSATLVAPGGSTLGLLPGIPVLGALPGTGAAEASQLWWLAGGVAAGIVAATVIVLGRPAARFDETSLVGGAAGALSGAVFAGLAWLSGGGLGAGRLAEIGPRMLPLLILGVSTLGLSGLAAGLLLGLARGQLLPRLRRRTADPAVSAEPIAGERGGEDAVEGTVQDAAQDRPPR